MLEKGCEVTVFTGKPNYPKGKFFKGYGYFSKGSEIINNIKVIRSNLIPRAKGRGLSLFINYISFVLFGSFKLFLMKGKYDKILIYAPSPITVGFLGILASKIFRAKSYLWVHDLWPESVKAAGGIDNKIILNLINEMTKFIYKFSHRILIQSPRFSDYIVNQGVANNKIIYYPYYAESFYKKITTSNEVKKYFSSDNLNILFAGNIGIAQSFDTIIDAVNLINKEIKIKITVLGDGRDKERVINKIGKLNLNENFNFLGSFPPERMSDFFSAADALLVTLKKSEIFSMTIPGKMQSYLACGKPIIGSLDGIGSEIINDASCGFSSNAESSRGLAKSFLKFNKLSFKERKIFGVNSKKYYKKEFDREKLLSKLINIFAE
ncbi:glycosyltransferase family 4 protein [Flavobacteriaceae bacterium]|nr:glycosyltransferase family 4 protein [Flavobacteriaceae bacterium]